MIYKLLLEDLSNEEEKIENLLEEELKSDKEKVKKKNLKIKYKFKN